MPQVVKRTPCTAGGSLVTSDLEAAAHRQSRACGINASVYHGAPMGRAGVNWTGME